MKIILNKFISQSGFCSRRQAEVFNKKGQVEVNGRPAEPGMKVDEDDIVKIGEHIVNVFTKKIYIILNKPVGYTSTTRSFKNENNVLELIPADIKKNTSLFIAGRLDKNSRGLILLTNDGDVAQKLTHPKYQHQKVYEVEIILPKIDSKKEITEIINKLKKGIDIGEGDGLVKAQEAEYLQKGMFRIVLIQGKKRQIRRMFTALGLKVKDLCRVQLDFLNIAGLPSGKWRFLSVQEEKKLIKATSLKANKNLVVKK